MKLVELQPVGFVTDEVVGDGTGVGELAVANTLILTNNRKRDRNVIVNLKQKESEDK